MRVQVGRQRKQILQLQRAGIATAAAELMLARMLAKIEGLCAERDRLKAERAGPMKGAEVSISRLIKSLRRTVPPQFRR
jgi:hypothetical protein